MFTGLIETTGRIERIDPVEGGRRVRIGTSLGAELHAGDSVSVNGVCLTATERDASGFAAQVSPETLRVTSFAALRAGTMVNLERPLRADGRFGGHFVLGHVDAVGRVAAVRAEGEYYWLDVDFPPELAPYLILKGSIAVDGISLTVAALTDQRFGIQIVPFTWTHTSVHALRPDDPVNLEADVIGKYVARAIQLQAVHT